MRKLWHVQVDAREQRPLPIPHWLPILLPGDRTGTRTTTIELVSERVVLDAGDYRLAEAPHACIVERKGSLRELAGNCLTGDRERFRRALQRLRNDTPAPYVIVEGTPASLLRDRTVERPFVALDAALRTFAEFRIPVLYHATATVGSHAALGEFVVRLLLAHALTADHEEETK